METAIQDVVNVIKYNSLDDIVLVGHSFAGKVVAAVADRAPERVRMVLYMDAFRPDKVRTAQGSFNPEAEFGKLGPGEWKIPFSGKILEMIGKDVRGADKEWMLSKGTPWPLKLASDPLILSRNFDTVKSAYIFCSQSGDPVDEIVAGKWGKLEGPHKVIESGHFPMVTKPDQLVKDMLALTDK
ncbi:MAG TPA: alpha/beta hydrolase, partial [Candidatus Binatus sp.]|nr:alpha/beta hydrolase [Candidatus Binatus sp.]